MSELFVSVFGVHGIVGDSLTPQTACDLGLAFAALLAQGGISGPVVVGRDSRPSGRMIEQAVTAGLLGSGLTVRPVGVVAMPSCALAVRELRCVGGVMITASRHPSEYNGLKFMHSDGQCLSASAMQRLAYLLRSRLFRVTDHAARFEIEPDDAASARHVAKVLQCVQIDRIRALRMAVLLDSGNGSGGIAGKMLLENLECRTLLEHGEPTGRFLRAPEPTLESSREACRKASAAAVIVGFVQDADADRLALIDETGRYVGEEYTFALAARAALANRAGPLAASLSTSRMIDDVAATMGVRVVRTAVGEANVAQAVAQYECVLGGEGNGGVIDPRVSPVHDSIVAMALVLDLLARTGKPLSKLVAELPRYHMVRRKYPVPRDGVGPMLQRVVAAGQGALINDADGIRIDWPEGWAHVRASSTEQAYRVVAEGRDEVDTTKILQHVVAAAGSA